MLTRTAAVASSNVSLQLVSACKDVPAETGEGSKVTARLRNDGDKMTREEAPCQSVPMLTKRGCTNSTHTAIGLVAVRPFSATNTTGNGSSGTMTSSFMRPSGVCRPKGASAPGEAAGILLSSVHTMSCSHMSGAGVALGKILLATSRQTGVWAVTCESKASQARLSATHAVVASALALLTSVRQNVPDETVAGR
ncbi:hypothetical protein BCV69DRAFT_11391 [Microstroma glucosiphilum]|uniref:Uncharacterized protein n=1 Tax=Pseudomicrostroma glucosiphilum TaxID=1684307 RepID=A0A316UKS2_9BASI|nr:hypothetical protein BCV69DRAFT_11391 [Pseudomicrostroma glucosiphilum]PWN23835.1 hypothetical protein BCV69DRAFT_11391 [Pseudomicrostroma glucosiphilum]